MKVFALAIGFITATMVSASPAYPPLVEFVVLNSYKKVLSVKGIKTANIPVVN